MKINGSQGLANRLFLQRRQSQQHSG
jgi:hypothetical protein